MNVKITFLLFALLFVAIAYAQPSEFSWGVFGSGANTKNPYALALDKNQNVYAGGYFSSTVVFDSGNSNTSITASSGTNGFLYRIDSSGHMNWAINFGGSGNSRVQDIAVDDAGMIYAFGDFTGTVDFNPDPQITESRTSAGSMDIFLCKIDPSGKLIWAKSFSSDFTSYGYRIQINHQNQLIIGGVFGDSLHWGSGSSTHDLYTTSYDLFVAKADTSGTLVWAKNFHSNNSIFMRDIGIADNDDILFTGGFKGTCDFNPDPNTDLLVSSAVNNTIYLTSISDSGTFNFAFALFGDTYANNGGRSVVSNQNVIYLSGGCSGWLDFDPGSSFDTASAQGGGNGDMFIAKYSLSGQLIDYGIIGGTNADILYEIALDSSGNVYGAGNFVDSCDMDPGSGTTYLYSYGVNGISGMLFKWDKNLNFQWTRGISGNAYSTLLRLVVDDSTNVYFNTAFQGKNDFDPTPDTVFYTAYGTDMLTSKWGECIPYQHTDTVWTCGQYSWQNKVLDSSGIYSDSLSSSQGCDSILYLVLNIYQSHFQIQLSACDSFNWNGTYLLNSGTYTDTLMSSHQCDSIVTLTLSLSLTKHVIQQFSSCDSLNYLGKTYYQSVNLKDTLASSSGCDSIVETNLIVHSSALTSLQVDACDSFIFKGNTFKTNTILYDSLATYYGCDSIVQINLSVHSRFMQFMLDTACQSYSWRGKQLIHSGLYADSLHGTFGCDSIYLLKLVIETLNDSVYLINNGIEAFQNGIAYQWLNCSNAHSPINGAQSRSYYPPHSAQLAVELRGAVCIDTSFCLNFIAVGLDRISNGGEVTIYPNPGLGNLRIAGVQVYPIDVLLFDAAGRRLIEKRIVNESEAHLSVEGRPGVYLVRVISPDGQQWMLRYVKE